MQRRKPAAGRECQREPGAAHPECAAIDRLAAGPLPVEHPAREAERAFREQNGIAATDPDNNQIALRIRGIAERQAQLDDRIAASSANLTQLRQAEAFVAANMRRGMRIRAMAREETTEYPLAVVREALNEGAAVMPVQQVYGAGKTRLLNESLQRARVQRWKKPPEADESGASDAHAAGEEDS